MRTSRHLHPGDRVTPRTLRSITGQPVPIPGDRLTHLQFRRYAGCPVCNQHLRSFTARHNELVDADITEVAVFHSTTATMQEFQAQLPFAAIADPERVLYTEFDVDTITARTFWKGITPRSWAAAATALRTAPTLKGALGPGEKHLALPAEMLITTDGHVLAAHYGEYVNDHWSVDDVLHLAARLR